MNRETPLEAANSEIETAYREIDRLRAENERLREGETALHDEIQRILDLWQEERERAEAAEARLKEARKMLAALQYVNTGYCPSCVERLSHAYDCKLAALIQRIEELNKTRNAREGEEDRGKGGPLNDSNLEQHLDRKS